MRGSHDINVIRNSASGAVQNLRSVISPAMVKRAVGTAVTRTIQQHLNSLGPNKRGWPSTHFYQGAARGTGWDATPTGVVIYIDNEKHPGAMRQRYHGGPINMKDKLLTLPAAAPFYGHSATEFTNLRFQMYGKVMVEGRGEVTLRGTKALVVDKGGVGIVNFVTGKERSVKGAGARAAGLVAYWLRESVNQYPDPKVIPDDDTITVTAIDAVADLVAKSQVGGRR